MANADTTFNQKIAIPSYFEPGAKWTQMHNAYPTVGRSIINPISGPGANTDPMFTQQVEQAQAAGLTVLGYVHTSYGKRNKETVVADVDKYYSWYGVDGIFFDEASTECAKAVGYYEDLYLCVKETNSSAVVALNPGTHTSERYMDISSVVVTFEGSYRDYVRGYSAPAWVSKYPPSRFWHLVHGTSTTKQLETAVSLSKTRGAGWVYVTPDRLPNPWDTLPTGSFWERELAAVSRG